MRIIKRSGKEVGFDVTKIIEAIRKANKEVSENEQLTEKQILNITERITDFCEAMDRTYNVEEIQDLVENELMEMKAFEVARKYITYSKESIHSRKSSPKNCSNLRIILQFLDFHRNVRVDQNDHLAIAIFLCKLDHLFFVS